MTTVAYNNHTPLFYSQSIKSSDYNYNPRYNNTSNFSSYPTWIQYRLHQTVDFDNGESQLIAAIQERIRQKSQDPISNLSPASMAVLVQRDDLLLQLMQIDPYCIHQPDSQGYTPAHFAAILGSRSTLSLLENFGAEFTQQTTHGATVCDFLYHRGMLNRDEHSSDDPLFSANALLCIWHENRSPPKTSLANRLEKSLQDFKQKRLTPPIVVKLVENNGSPLQGQREVVASRDIQAGEFIIEYSGNVITTQHSHDNTYTMALTEQTSIDASKYGNSSRFINHGPPNCNCQEVYYQGVPRIAIFALRPISKDEPILFNYSSGYFINRPFYELNPAFLAGWIAANGLRIKAFDTTIQAEEKKEIYMYLYEFPEYLIDCIKEKSLDKQQVLEFMHAAHDYANGCGRALVKYRFEEKIQRIQSS